MLLEARTMTKKEGTHKYSTGEGMRESQRDGLNVEILVCTHDFKICACVCKTTRVGNVCVHMCMYMYRFPSSVSWKGLEAKTSWEIGAHLVP